MDNYEDIKTSHLSQGIRVNRLYGGNNMNTSMNMKPKNESLWNRFVSLFRPRDRDAEIRNAIMEILNVSSNSDWCHGIADAIYTNNYGEIAADIRDNIDTYEIAQEFDTHDIAQEILEDVCDNIDITQEINDEVEHQLKQITLTSFSSEVEDIITNKVEEQMGELMETVLAEIAGRLVAE